jgi:prepilin-type N-terminal cleavage/methylation domain-containing protein
MDSRRRAVTLLELTIVILVVGILAAVGVPRFNDSVRGAMLQSAALQMAAHIELIRNTAINEGRMTTLVCDHSVHSYSSPDVDFAERLGTQIFVSLPQTYDAGFTLAANFDSQQQLTFDFEGVPYVGDSPLVEGQIVLRSGGGEYWIRIATGTGRTSVVRPTVAVVDGVSGASG